MMWTFHCSTPTEADCKALAKRLSFLDRREITVYNPDRTPEAALLEGLAQSEDCKMLYRNGLPVAAWGVLRTKDELEDDYGMPWLLSIGSDEYDLATTRALLKATQRSITRWHYWWDFLAGFSWAEAKDHHRLLKKLGVD